MKVLFRAALLVLTLFLSVAVAKDKGKDKDKTPGSVLHAELIGLREVPAVSTQASGQFNATIINEAAIDYELTYSGLESNVTQGHIHIGQKFVAGGITLWLCQTATNKDPTNLAPQCPQSGTVHGLLTEKNIVGPAAQGITDGVTGGTLAEFAEILKLIRSGFTYANVHSVVSPSGEIRGQIKVVGSNDDDDED
jgi:hypothetical protein